MSAPQFSKRIKSVVPLSCFFGSSECGIAGDFSGDFFMWMILLWRKNIARWGYEERRGVKRGGRRIGKGRGREEKEKGGKRGRGIRIVSLYVEIDIHQSQNATYPESTQTIHCFKRQ